MEEQKNTILVCSLDSEMVCLIYIPESINHIWNGAAVHEARLIDFLWHALKLEEGWKLVP